MKAVARRSQPLMLELDFSSRPRRNGTLEAYAAELHAGLTREGWTQEALSHVARVSQATIRYHRNQEVRNPQVRTMFSLLFALGWDEIVISKGGVQHRRQRVAS